MHSNQETIAQSKNVLFAMILCLMSSTTAAWILPSTRTMPTPTSRLHYENPKQFLSSCDLMRLKEMRNRHETVPILILDALVPGQAIEFGSAEANFGKLVAHVLGSSSKGEIGIIGLHPTTGNPLNMGVTVSVQANNVKRDAKHGSLVISGTGSRRFEVQGEPFLHADKFYMANVEMTPEEETDLPKEQEDRARELIESVPEMVKKWKQLIVDNSSNNNKAVLNDEPIPDKDIAFWIASLVNRPFQKESIVGMDIRPAMLACKNEYERIHLACTALACGIDRMS